VDALPAPASGLLELAVESAVQVLRSVAERMTLGADSAMMRLGRVEKMPVTAPQADSAAPPAASSPLLAGPSLLAAVWTASQLLHLDAKSSAKLPVYSPAAGMAALSPVVKFRLLVEPVRSLAALVPRA
jgi:hypothetical protein